MKKTVLVVLASALALSASAQTWQDALLFSENEYTGTARSAAMGNALTAVGGDLGSIGINPAGSAVAGYAQFTLTPSLSFSVANATSDNPNLAFGDRVRTSYTRLKMPNLGFTFHMDTGRKSGLKRMTFGFVLNATNDFTGRMYAAGVNATNSFCGSLASSAAGYPEDVLSGASSTISWWNLDDHNETYGLSWKDMVGYRSGIFGTVNGRYTGLTDWDNGRKWGGTLADLYQKYGLQTKGYKQDMLFNFALNYSDELYVGANLGFTLLRYGQAEYWYEAPNKESEFPPIPFDTNPDARFRSLEMKRIFDVKGAGAYLKLGVLWRTQSGLRLGAALQTPTITNLDTRLAYYGKANVTGVALSGVQSPEWQDAYALVSPWRFNAGIAYTFGKAGLLSVDYEHVNYSRSFFRSQAESGIYYGVSYFQNTNADIKDILGSSHMLRAGAELNVAPGVALRAGYSLATSGQHNYLEWVYDEKDGKEHLMVFQLSDSDRAALAKHTLSAGVGFTRGAFFTDITFRYRSMPTMYVTPYEYYDYDGTDYTSKYSVNGVDTEKYPEYSTYQVPTVTATYRRFDAILTMGVRF